jgi:hypothetical protein
MGVVSLPVQIVPPEAVIRPFTSLPGGAWSARPLVLQGLEHPLLIAEASPLVFYMHLFTCLSLGICEAAFGTCLFSCVCLLEYNVC